MASDPASTMHALRSALRAADGPVTLLGYDTDGRPLAPGGRNKLVQAIEADGALLALRQEKLFAAATAGDRRRVLLVLQGMDTSGKDGVVRHVVGSVGPAAVRIASFKKPTPEEAAHHFLWRVRRQLPAAGMLGVFNRSHYEDVVVTRVHECIDDAEWAQRIADINRFEAELVAAGTTMVKCFLHISYTEQRRRLLARLDDPTKVWKFNPADIDERAYWSDYQTAYGTALTRTSTEHAPWYIVPGDDKRYRDFAVGQLLLAALSDINADYPAAAFDVDDSRRRLQPPF